MNSSDAFGHSKRQIELDPVLFGVIFQVTVQLRELPVGRVQEGGLAQPRLEALIDVLRSVRDLVERCDKVRIDVVDEEVSPLNASIADTSLGVGLYGREVVAKLPAAIEVAWIPLLKYVASWLGERELFLRTGYYANEVSDSIAALSGDL